MITLKGVIPRLQASGDLTQQVEKDCAQNVAQFHAAIAEIRSIGHLAAARVLTVAEAAALAKAVSDAERRHAHLVSYAKLLPEIAQNRRQRKIPKGSKPDVTALMNGPIRDEFLAWRRKQPTQWPYDYTAKRANSPFGTFANRVVDHFADQGVTISVRSIINRTGAWLDEI